MSLLLAGGGQYLRGTHIRGRGTKVYPTTDSGWASYLNGSRLFLPAGTNYCTNPSFEGGLANVVLAFDGNSTTVGTGATSGHDYPSVLFAAIPKGTGWVKVNAGSGGHTIQNMIDETAAIVDGYYDAGATHNICVVFNGQLDETAAADTVTLLGTYCAARQVVGWKVIVCTLPSYGWGDVEEVRSRATINSLIRANYTSWADGLADLAADSRIGDNGDYLDSAYFADAIHMTDAGYAVVAGIVQTAVTCLLGPAPGWAVYGSYTGTPIVSLVPGRNGGYAQRVQYTGVAGDAAGKYLFLMCATPAASMAPGDVVTASYHGKVANSIGYMDGMFSVFDSGNGWLAGADLDGISNTSEWATGSFTSAPLVSSADHVWLTLRQVGIVEGTVVDFITDDVLIEKSLFAAPYFDGSSPDCAWTGTANASTSTRTASALTYPVPSALSGMTSGTVAMRMVPLADSTDTYASVFIPLSLSTSSLLGLVLYLDELGLRTPSSTEITMLGAVAGAAFDVVARWEGGVSQNVASRSKTASGTFAETPAIDIIRVGSYTGGIYQPCAYIGPVIISPARKSDAWVAAIQANSGAAYNDLSTLWGMMSAGDLLLPLVSDGVGWVKR